MMRRLRLEHGSRGSGISDPARNVRLPNRSWNSFSLSRTHAEKRLEILKDLVLGHWLAFGITQYSVLSTQLSALTAACVG